jgi:signal transduction histidine kinase
VPDTVDPGPDVWHRTRAGWHLAYAVLVLLTAALTAADSAAGPGRRAVVFALLGALALGYATLAAPVLHTERGRRGLVYVLVAVPLTLALVATGAAGTVMLFVLYPHLWSTLPARRAMVATVCCVLGTAAAILTWPGVRGMWVGGVLVPAVVGLVVAMLLGLWITRIIEQSRRRAALVTELARTRAELATVSRTAGVLAERQRLGREIHDTLAQGFTSVLLLVQAAEAALGTDRAAVARHLALARRTAQENLAEARAMLAALTPPDLRDSPLPEAVERLVRRTAEHVGVEVALRVCGQPRPLPVEREIVLLRGAQEALTNVGRHAGAARVEVTLDYRGERVSVQVSDDGDGFDPGTRQPGFGLTGLTARAAEVGGTVDVTAAAGAGATVRVEVGG